MIYKVKTEIFIGKQQTGTPQAENFVIQRYQNGKICDLEVSKWKFPKANWLAADGKFCDLENGNFQRQIGSLQAEIFAI